MVLVMLQNLSLVLRSKASPVFNLNLEYGVPTMVASAAFASLRLCRPVRKALRMDKDGPPRDVGNAVRHLHPVDGTGMVRPDRPNLTKVAIQKT